MSCLSSKVSSFQGYLVPLQTDVPYLLGVFRDCLMSFLEIKRLSPEYAGRQENCLRLIEKQGFLNRHALYISFMNMYMKETYT